MSATRAFRWSCALILSSFFLAACGGSDSNDAGSGGGATTAATTGSGGAGGGGTGGAGTGGAGGGQAAATTFEVRLENDAPWTVLKSGVFNTPVGKASPGPIKSGDAYEVVFTAGKPHKVSFVMMFGASNDWFYGTAPEGIALYDGNGQPVSGDVTAQIHLYNAGTEIDEEPGVGVDTGPKQADPTQGAADPDDTVREIESPAKLSDGTTFAMPPVNQVLKVTLGPTGNDREFKLRIENVSTAVTLVTSEGPKGIGLSPGVFAIHSAPEPFFTLGQKDRGEGLELVAESGRVDMLAAAIAAKAGAATPFSPGVWVVHASGEPLFKLGEHDRGQGLERIAESGNPMPLSTALGASMPEGSSALGVFDTPEGADKPGAIAPGAAYVFQVQARPGDRLSFASMFGFSNDWVLATPEDGIPLFDDQGSPAGGDATASLQFVDVGTEMDEDLAVGAHTGPNQSDPDSGDPDSNPNVRNASEDGYATAPSAHVKLTITPKP